MKLRTSSVFQDDKLLHDSVGCIHHRANVLGCRLPVLSTPTESKPWEEVSGFAFLKLRYLFLAFPSVR